VECVLSIIIRNHGYQDILEEIKWLNVRNVEQLFHSLRRGGQWPRALHISFGFSAASPKHHLLQSKGILKIREESKDD
jgi:hypothetical protein